MNLSCFEDIGHSFCSNELHVWQIRSLLSTCDTQSSLEHVVVGPGVLVVKLQQRIIFEKSRSSAAGISLLHKQAASAPWDVSTPFQNAATGICLHSQAQTGPGDCREDAWVEGASPDNTQREKPQLLNPARRTATARRRTTTAGTAKDFAYSPSRFL